MMTQIERIRPLLSVQSPDDVHVLRRANSQRVVPANMVAKVQEVICSGLTVSRIGHVGGLKTVVEGRVSPNDMGRLGLIVELSSTAISVIDASNGCGYLYACEIRPNAVAPVSRPAT